MNYYVVSEIELKAALKAVRAAELMASSSGVRDERFELLAEVAEAACRARPVPEWATHFCKLDYYKVGDQIQEAEEIKK